jgi:pheromone shutdown protein TraB
MAMITLIGTGHVFNLSQALLEVLDQKQPDLVGVELDNQRYQALLMKQLQPEQYEQARKNVPFLYRIFARFQDNMADEYGVVAGEEMLTAIKYAQSHQLPFELLDMNAQQLFRDMIRAMSFREKFRLLVSGITGLFVSKEKVESELEKIEVDFDQYIQEVGKQFPTVKRMLIDKRNEYMADILTGLSGDFEHIVACIGDGHIPGLLPLFEEKHVEVETVRLRELRDKVWEKKDASSGFFSTQYSAPGDMV